MLRISRLNRVLFAALGVAVATQAAATEVALVGVFGAKAVLSVDGGAPKTLGVGERTREGVRLVEVAGEHAVVEIGGKARRVGLGETAIRLDGGQTGPAAVSLYPDTAGHHFANGAINGAGVRFLVDTGATMVSIGMSDARRAGIEYRRGQAGLTQTASGPATVWRVRLDSVRVGDITLHGVDGLVHENDLPFVLLGMSFLNRMDMQREGERLVLRKRY